MTTIKCEIDICVHNRKYRCMLKEVHIGRDSRGGPPVAKCDSFVELTEPESNEKEKK